MTRAGRQLEEQPETVDELAEVIDLTDQKLEVNEARSEHEMARQHKDREMFLLQQRDIMLQSNIQMNEGRGVWSELREGVLIPI